MAKAIAAETRVAYIAEVTPNTTPATPVFQVLRATGETLKVERQYVDSSELNADRAVSNSVLVAKSGSGSIDVELTDATLEDLLEGVLRATWATDTLSDANADKPFTFEATYEGGGTDVYKRLTGARISSLALTFATADIIRGSLAVLSQDAEFDNAIIPGATYTAGNAEVPETGDTVAALTMAGLTPACISQIVLNINNNLRLQRCLNGNLHAADVVAGSLEIGGTITLLLSPDEYNVLQAYQDGTETDLVFTVGRTTLKKYTFDLERVTLTDARVVASSSEGDVVAEIDFRGLLGTSGRAIRITRNVA